MAAVSVQRTLPDEVPGPEEGERDDGGRQRGERGEEDDPAVVRELHGAEAYSPNFSIRR